MCVSVTDEMGSKPRMLLMLEKKLKKDKEKERG